MKTAVITGGSSGIGKATAVLLSESGYRVYELSRSGQSGSGVTHVTADLTDEPSVRAAFDSIPEAHIDLLVCNAGMGISGAVEHTALQDARFLFNVNFFGAAACVAAARRRMSGGRIILLSSVAAVLPIPYQSYYSASKAAINALTLCLRSELKIFGISVCALLPGDVATGFTAARIKNDTGDSDYQGRIRRSVAVMEKDERSGMSPQVLARRIFRLAEKRYVKPFYSCGLSYQFFCLLAKLLPRSVSNWLVGKIYG